MASTLRVRMTDTRRLARLEGVQSVDEQGRAPPAVMKKAKKAGTGRGARRNTVMNMGRSARQASVSNQARDCSPCSRRNSIESPGQ